MNKCNHFSILNSSLLGVKKGMLLLILFICVCFFSCLTEDELTEINYAPVTVETTAITSITTTSAVTGGNLTAKQTRNILSRGVCWSLSPNPTIIVNKTTDSKGMGRFTSTITGLTPGTTYYVRAYAVNNLETTYGNEVTFTTVTVFPPTLTTSAISAITATTATSGGIVSNFGNGVINAQGVCWSTNENPTIVNSKTSDSIKSPIFASAITGLTPNTKYYVRAYATNFAGTSYGNQLSFTTSAQGLPSLTTTAMSAITQTTAASGGNIVSDGGLTVTARGICWSTTTNPTTALTTKTSDGTGISLFTSALTGLTASTTYYVRAYATNSMGTSYGNEISFTTLAAPTAPILTTTAISAITPNTASSGGNIASDGGASVTARGVCWSTSASPTIANSKTTDGTGIGIFTSAISGLTTGTTYYVRAYAINSIGTAYGDEVSFTTVIATVPILTTTPVSGITTISADGGGNITSDGGASVTVRGVCWSNSSSPTIDNYKTTNGSGIGIFTSYISGLTAGSTYYVRAYATNSVGTGYGNEVSFTANTPSLSITTALIPAGTFTMGSPISEVSRGTDETQHTVTLSAFRMSKYEITNAQYAAFLNAKGIGSNGIWASAPAYPTQALIYAESTMGLTYSGTQWVSVVGYETSPVIYVTWYGAVEFATYAGGTLPTEAQWEYACRGGTTTPFSTGNFLTNLQANYNWAYPYNGGNNTVTTGLSKSQPVGTYAPNAYGLYDMHGNVWEWCSDWYGTYPTTAQTNPTGASTGSSRVFRGGGWYGYAQDCRSADRYKDYPNIGNGIFGVRVVFAIASVQPSVSTTAITNITISTATSGGNVTNDGGATVTARGVCWSTTTSPTTSNSKTTDGTGTGTFTSALAGLTANTKYYVRAYATNSAGTSYGNEVSFTTITQITAPTLTTTAISAITTTSASGGGNVTSDGGATVTSRGVCWSTSAGPTIANSKTTDGTGTGIFISALTGLNPITNYYVRAYATNSAGTSYGNEVMFTTATPISIPTVTTSAITAISNSGASGGGNVTSDGAGTIIARGVCWSTSTGPTIANSKTTDGTGTGTFTSSITGLVEGTTNYVRAYATNSAGTGYGNEVSFKTSSPTVSDIDGNVYHTVTIGTQTWMVENLKTATYRDGTPIPNITDGTAWSALTTGAYCDYNNTPSNSTTYGKLYNWYAATDVRNIAPVGWHVPTDAEWTTLTDYLGGLSVAGGKLKEAGTTHWLSPNTGATNETGFTALPGGVRDINGGFGVQGTFGVWWSSSEYTTSGAWERTIFNDDSRTGRAGNDVKQKGFSIRCIKGEILSQPTLTTTAVSAITSTTATSGGNVISDGGAIVTSRGVCWSTSSSPTIANSKTSNGTGTGAFTSSITGLSPSTTYYIRAYSTNSVGTSYGNEVSFTTATPATAPTLTTTTISDVTPTTAASGGNITSDGGATITARGVCWSTNASANPTISDSKTTDGGGTGIYTSSLSGLNPSTTYFYRAYATNSVGTSYGNVMMFISTIPITVPILTTTATSAITDNTATSGGNITNDGGATVTARGVCWSTSSSPTITNSKTSNGTGTGSFTSSITGLTAGTTYYIRAYATNSLGTAYGAQVSFTTNGTVADIEGNIYHTITIGTQVWMVENLKTTTYNDGTSIPNVTNNTSWAALTSGAYCWYNNDLVSYKNTYGALYNWYTVNTGKLAPTGWHVPTDADWTTLVNYVSANLGISGSVAKALAAKTNWTSSTSTGAIGNDLTKNNSTEFTALPGGFRYSDGNFVELLNDAGWWSSSEYDTSSAWESGFFNYDNTLISTHDTKSFGSSVRCIKDY